MVEESYGVAASCRAASWMAGEGRVDGETVLLVVSHRSGRVEEAWVGAMSAA